MPEIFLITDYQNRFGTKYTAVPYRSGMNKALLAEEFRNLGYDPVFLNATEAAKETISAEGKVYIYTSSEDEGDHYKSFLEDLILSISVSGGNVVPQFKYLRAHNNKVFMELLRKSWGSLIGDPLKSVVFGSYEELISSGVNLSFPVVIKRPEGFKSRGVFRADNMNQLRKIAFKISRTKNRRGEIKDFIRTFIHKDFRKESKNRRKFLVQEFIDGLQNDFKVLIFGEKYYVLSRRTRENDFRASGSGIFNYPEELPEGLLNFCENAFNYFDVPFISLDVAYNNNHFNILEAQFLYFGTYTLEKSLFYYRKEAGNWKRINEISVLEKEYAQSISLFLSKNKAIK